MEYLREATIGHLMKGMSMNQIKDGDTPHGDGVDDWLMLLLRGCGEVGTESLRDVVIGSDREGVDPDWSPRVTS